METTGFPGLIPLIRERGPQTVAAFMDLALYHPRFGYYARAAQRSGRAGDFFTSVDVSALFGELIAEQVLDMAAHLSSSDPLDLVEAGAGNGRLAADVLTALARRAPALYDRTRLHLVESSARARAAQADTLGPHRTRLVGAGAQLPSSFAGVLFANELLDAMPVHRVVQRAGQLHEVYVIADPAGPERLTTSEGSLSTPALAAYLDDEGITLSDGQTADLNLAAPAWLADACARLARGFILLFDYGYPAQALYSAARPNGTLTAYRGHTGREAQGWLASPGEQDLTAHVDFTALARTAAAAGLDVLGFVDQTYFVLGLAERAMAARHGAGTAHHDPAEVKRRLALKTLMLPGGLGSTMKAIAFGRQVGRPALAGFPPAGRVTP